MNACSVPKNILKYYWHELFKNDDLESKLRHSEVTFVVDGKVLCINAQYRKHVDCFFLCSFTLMYDILNNVLCLFTLIYDTLFCLVTLMYDTHLCLFTLMYDTLVNLLCLFTLMYDTLVNLLCLFTLMYDNLVNLLCLFT